MANERGQSVPISPFDPEPTPSAGVPGSVGGAASAAGDALSGVSSVLQQRVGAWGDQLAAQEGKRAGLVAGTDPNYRPTNGPTIRDQAYDAAATHNYLSNLTAQFHSDALDLAEQNRANPAGFVAGMTALVQKYKANDVFPEIEGQFTDTATNLTTMLRRHLWNQFEERQNATNRATMLDGISQNNTSAQRILEMAPNDPAAEAQITQLRDQNVASINQQVANGALDPVQAQKLILQQRQESGENLYAARAKTLADPADIGLYRQKLRQDFAAGKLDGISDYTHMDAAIAKVQQQKQVAQSSALKSLEGDLNTYLTQSTSGLTPNTAEWAQMEATGKSLGPAGISLVATARLKLNLQQKLQSLSPDQADVYLEHLETDAKTAPITGPGVKTTGYSPQAQGDVIEGDYHTAVMGPDGYADAAGKPLARTLEDVRTGKSNYVSIAGDPSFYGRRYILPSVTYTANGQKYTLNNVQGVVNDTGDAFKGAPEGRFDVAIARDLNMSERNQDMSGVKFVPASQGTGIWSGTADVLNYGKSFNAARRKIISTDPLAGALADNTIPAITPVDFNGAPADVAAQMRARVAQADTVAQAYQRPPQYIRPDELPVVKAKVEQGGPAALDTLSSIVSGAGRAAPAILKQIGDGAPEMVHAAYINQATGDPMFARQVADSIAASKVPGQKMPNVGDSEINKAVTAVIGNALDGVDATEVARTRAAAVAWTKLEMQRQGIPDDGPINQSRVQDILQTAVQKARGQTGSGENTYGGVASVGYGGAGMLWGQANSIPVQVPTNVKSSKFGDVLGAVTSDDLKGLPNPPVDKAGNTMTADTLRRYAPVFGPGGYRFVSIDPATNMKTPVVSKSGVPFVLPMQQMETVLRQRVPGAYR